MHDQDVPLLPACLPLLRTQLSYRFRESARLPAYKGGMLRGGFGYAFQRAACPQSCWGAAQNCPQPVICPYRWVFETPHPPAVSALHDLRDVPRHLSSICRMTNTLPTPLGPR